MGRSSREKGKRGEREAARCLTEDLGIQARRGVQFAGGINSPDVVHDLPGVHFEVKYHKREIQWKPALVQLFADSGSAVPVLLHRRNGTRWVLTLPKCRITELCRLLLAYWHSPVVQWRGASSTRDFAVTMPGLHWETDTRRAFNWDARWALLKTNARGSVPVLEHVKIGTPLASVPLDRAAEFVRLQAAYWHTGHENGGITHAG